MGRWNGHAWVSIGLLAIALIAGRPARAFHDGGAASCNGCHVMHRSEDGQPVEIPGGRNPLLRAESSSDPCLSYHADEFGAIFATDPLNPSPMLGGGNFVFLLEDNLNDGPDGATNRISGDAARHNINRPGSWSWRPTAPPPGDVARRQLPRPLARLRQLPRSSR